MAASSAVLPTGSDICCITMWINFRAGCVSRMERKWYKHSGRNADVLKSHSCPPVAVRRLKPWSSGNRDFPGGLMLGKKKAKGGCQTREELLSQEEVSQSSESSSDRLAGDGGAQAMMALWYPLAVTALAARGLCFHLISYPEDEVEVHWFSLFLSPAWPQGVISFSLLSPMTCVFHCPLEERASAPISLGRTGSRL